MNSNRDYSLQGLDCMHVCIEELPTGHDVHLAHCSNLQPGAVPPYG